MGPGLKHPWYEDGQPTDPRKLSLLMNRELERALELGTQPPRVHVWPRMVGKRTLMGGTPLSPQTLVRLFHAAIGAPSAGRPGWPRDDRRGLRMDLLHEETSEALEAAHGDDLVHQVKELCDVLVVTYGWAEEMGIDLDACFRVVMADNMRKAGGPKRADGKQLKPEGYDPAQVRRELDAELRRQGYQTEEDE